MFHERSNITASFTGAPKSSSKKEFYPRTLRNTSKSKQKTRLWTVCNKKMSSLLIFSFSLSLVGLLSGRLISYINIYDLFAEPYIILFSFQFALAGVFVLGGDIYSQEYIHKNTPVLESLFMFSCEYCKIKLFYRTPLVLLLYPPFLS